MGDNRYTQDEEDFLIDTGPDWYGELPDIGVAERQQYLTMAVRDFLNEGGKLINAGEMAQDYGILERARRRASTTASTAIRRPSAWSPRASRACSTTA